MRLAIISDDLYKSCANLLKSKIVYGEYMIKIGLFSGRFDPPNAGHFLTLEELLTECHYLLVPILHYKDRIACTALEAKRIFEHHFCYVLSEFCRYKIKFIINGRHFGKITIHELNNLVKSEDLNLEDITYLSGNREVLKHIKSLGVKTKYVQRVSIPGIDQYLFESTKIRKKMKKSGKNLEEIYNIKF